MPIRIPRPFLTHLEAIRLQRNLTQHELSAKARVEQKFISMLERGEALATPDQAARIAKVLGTSPDLLLLPVQLSTEAAS